VEQHSTISGSKPAYAQSQSQKKRETTFPYQFGIHFLSILFFLFFFLFFQQHSTISGSKPTYAKQKSKKNREKENAKVAPTGA